MPLHLLKPSITTHTHIHPPVESLYVVAVFTVFHDSIKLPVPVVSLDIEALPVKALSIVP